MCWGREKEGVKGIAAGYQSEKWKKSADADNDRERRENEWRGRGTIEICAL